MADTRIPMPGAEKKEPRDFEVPVERVEGEPMEPSREHPVEGPPVSREAEPPAAETPAPAAPTQVPAVQKKVEKILEEDIEDIYRGLTPDEQHRFRIKGEETSTKVTEALRQAKVKIADIIKLVAEWLKTLPGVSRFYVEQEAKIKAEKILDIEK